MLWNELLRKGNVSLLQSQSDTQYCICRNYNPEAKEDIAILKICRINIRMRGYASYLKYFLLYKKQ